MVGIAGARFVGLENEGQGKKGTSFLFVGMVGGGVTVYGRHYGWYHTTPHLRMSTKDYRMGARSDNVCERGAMPALTRRLSPR